MAVSRFSFITPHITEPMLSTSGQPNASTPPTAPINAITTAMGRPMSISPSMIRKEMAIVEILMVQRFFRSDNSSLSS